MPSSEITIPDRAAGSTLAAAPRRSGSPRRPPSWLFLMPAAAAYGLVMLYPSVAGAYSAFTEWDGLSGAREFVGFDNFLRLFAQPESFAALRNTLLLGAFIVVFQTLFGLLLALALHRSVAGRGFWRVVFFTPVVLAPIAVSYLWQYIYGINGALNTAFGLLGLGAFRRDWLGDPDLALWSVGFVVVWQFVGITMVICLAGLQGIPQELFEAALTDGASRIQVLWHITLPLLRPALMVTIVLSTIGSIKLFDQVFVMTAGGPGTATETLSTALYRQAFTYGEYGYGASFALVIAILALGLGLLQQRLIQRGESS